MTYLLDDNATMLRDTAQRYFADADAIRSLRRWRDGRDLTAAATGAWGGMAELGFAGVLIPEAYGGAGLDSRAGIQVAEMMGKTLASGPFVSSAVMSATAILLGNNAKLKDRLLPEIATGKVVALAVEETARHDPHRQAAIATERGGRWSVTGHKIAVLDGNIAEAFIVTARIGDGTLAMMVVEAQAPGVTVEAHLGLDSRPVVAVSFEGAPSLEAGLICPPAETAALLDKVLDAGRLHLAAEMLGAAQEAFDRAVDYLKTRVQFGRKIGEFQALQHRAAILFGELEVARSTVLKAASAGDAGSVSMAKAKVGEVAKRAASEGVQMHGGIGVTDEFDMGFYMKRIRSASELLGDSAFHTERYARLQGL